MDRLFVLTRPVSIAGPDFWGRKSEITFSPSKLPGWWWNFRPNEIVEISAQIARKKKSRICLSFHDENLEVFEHIGSIAWLGLRDVIISSSKWPPHFGAVNPLWQRIKPFCKEEELRLPMRWRTITKPVRWEYPGLRGGQRGFTEILPANKPGLELDISYGYAPFGIKNACFSLPNQKILETILRFPSQGVSRPMYWASKVASFFGWPHGSTVIWPKHRPAERTMWRFVLHRTADLLGTLCLLCQKECPFACRVVSHFSGHEADIRAAQMANAFLTMMPAVKASESVG